MEPNENITPENDIPENSAPSEPEVTPTSSEYHGAGVGQKESPYASSPYYTAYQTRQPDYDGPAWQQNPNQNHYQPQPEPAKPPKQKKQRKKGAGKKILAAVLAVVLVAGSCGITAALVNNHWEKEVDSLESQLTDMQQQIDRIGSVGTGISVSGSPAASVDGLTPAQVYATNVNSVVSIGNYSTVTTSSGFFGGYTTTQEVVSTGSGFIISDDGYVMTNCHVVEGAQKLTVTTYMGDEYEAQLIGSDELNDVALLKIEATGLNAVTIGSSDDLIVGDQVVAIGNPLGELTSTQTVGYISGKDRSISSDGAIINMLQTDAAINSGNSGGPLFNMKGEVVGITTAKYSGSSASGASIEGIGFAIPIDDVMGMISDFKAYGYLRNQAYLGVTVLDIDSSIAAVYSLPDGSYVDTVAEGGSADRAGVQPKDIIIAIGEYEITGNTELTSTLRKFSAGDTTTITVFRAGQELVLDITFDEKPQDTSVDYPEETQPSQMPESGSNGE